MNPVEAVFADGNVSSAGRSVPLAEAARDASIVGEDLIEFAAQQTAQQSTFGAHFVEVGVDAGLSWPLNLVRSHGRRRAMVACI